MSTTRDQTSRAKQCADQLVCRCLSVSEREILDALDAYELNQVRDVIRVTGAGEGCTACHARLGAYLNARSYYSAGSSPICSVK